jgi:exodeoxyribonuclease-3
MSALRMATWNVNSLKVRLPQLLDWLATHPIDIVCLQELKLEDTQFPVEALQAAGYHSAFAGQKTYNGVAILSREPLQDIQRGIAGYDDPQQRVIAATVAGIRIICAYFPNGQAVGSDKYAYKLQWLEALHQWLGTPLAQHPQLALLGDYNIAPDDRDVYDPAGWADQILVSPPERAAFTGLLQLGLTDSLRHFHTEAGMYTWWDYRQAAFRRNRGLRIDHILITPPLLARALDCQIDQAPRRNERPSDHTPVVLSLTR